MPSTLSDLLAFLHASPTPFHAVASAASRLEAAGFRRIEETDSWSEITSGRYFVIGRETSIVAFVVPTASESRAFRIVGAHTDSPNLRLKPKPELNREGYSQLGVEVYGGVLLNSWLDRDLSLAGRVVCRESSGQLISRLLRIERPLLRIPQLAIHLDREVNDKGLVLNRQDHLNPVWALGSAETETIVDLCANELRIAASSIVNIDLMLFDVVPPTVGGRRDEFIFSARLDNQAMCHAAITALVQAADSGIDGGAVPLAALFDHEEVGSQSAQGAASSFLPRVLERIVLGTGGSRDDVHRTLAGSLCVSADMSHAVHPNYAARHEPQHKPVLNGGPVIKINSQQRYATSARTAALFQELCRKVDVPFQYYAHRTDLPCGSTIGPITSTLLGVPTVDVGNPMLSMHSAREMAGAQDPELMTRVLVRFFAGEAISRHIPK